MDNCWDWYGLILFIELFGEEIMKLYETNEIERIKNDLLNGEIVAFGTDTVFGLACVYDNPKAIQKVYWENTESISQNKHDKVISIL